MTWKDKLEIGLKDDASYRRDNLPESQIAEGGATTQADDPTRSPEEPGARDAADTTEKIAAAAKQGKSPGMAPGPG